MKSKLVWQLYLSYLVIILVSLAAVSWYASKSLGEFYIDQTKADLIERSRMFHERIHEQIALIDKSAIDDVCKAVGKRSGTRLTVLSPDGTVIGDSSGNPDLMDSHSDRPEFRGASAGRTETAIRYSRTLEQRMMYAAIPVQQANQVKAVVRMSVPLKPIDDELKSIRLHILTAGFFIAILASGLCFFVSRRITRPIERMKQSASQFAEGNFQYKLHVTENVEMAELARVMNYMAAQLEDRIQTVISQRNEIEAILSSMVEGVMALDNDERILKLNQAAADMLNVRLSGVMGKSIQEAIRNQGLHKFIKHSLMEEIKREEDLAMHRNGGRILNIRSTRLLDSEKRGIGVLLVLNDVTRLRWLETIRKEFAANVSHEIKTPLTAIKGSVETLKQGALEDREEANRFLSIVEKHVDRLTAIIDDLLYLSRIEKEDELRNLNPEKHVIVDILNGAAQVCRIEAEARKISIEIDCDPDISVPVDPLMMEQALVNLIDNAVKYSKEGSKVVLEAEITDHEALIHVHDWGIGVSEEHLPRLFERFYRVDKARSRKMGGTGLGLAIVKHIVRAHQGRIDVDSTPGKGSVFTIHLPK